MKAKLIKDEDGYSLFTREENSTNRKFIATTQGMYVDHKLSKQNCDEIFGVVDVEKLAEEFVNDLQVASETVNRAVKLGYEEGFNKAMELNKDKVFTLEDVIDVVFKQVRNGFDGVIDSFTEAFAKECINKAMELYQPTEIEVEIEMECLDPNCDGINKKGVCIPGDKPKLDSEGCLIIKKI
jgi:hypothetical protein